MKEQFTIRHKILEELFKSAAKEKNPQIPKIRLSSKDIAQQTNIPYEKIDIYHELLHEEGEINCEFCEPHVSHEMLITSKGRQSYIDSKYLKEGKKQFWDSIYDPLKIILPIISLLIASLALYQNFNSSHKIETVETQLNSFKTQLDSIKKEESTKDTVALTKQGNNEFKIDLSRDTLDLKLIAFLNGKWRVESKSNVSFLSTQLNYLDTVKFDDTSSISMTGWGKIHFNFSAKFYFSKDGSNKYEYHVNKDKKLLVTQIEYRNDDLSFKKDPEKISYIFALNILSNDKVELRNGTKVIELGRMRK